MAVLEQTVPEYLFLNFTIKFCVCVGEGSERGGGVRL